MFWNFPWNTSSHEMSNLKFPHASTSSAFMRYLHSLKAWIQAKKAILSKNKWVQKCKSFSPVLRIGYSKRAVTALQSFSNTSTVGAVFVGRSEHAGCGVERRHFSPSKLRLGWGWFLVLVHKLHLQIHPPGTQSSSPSVGCRVSATSLTLKSLWCLPSTCQGDKRIISQRSKGKIWSYFPHLTSASGWTGGWVLGNENENAME